MKLTKTLFLLSFLLIISGCSKSQQIFGDTMPTLSPWYFGSSNLITTRGTSSSVQIPSLSSAGLCLKTNASGTLSTTICGVSSQIGTTTINGVSGPNFTFSTSSDTNIGVTIVPSGSTFTWVPNWIGTLDNSRISSSSYWKGYADFSITVAGLAYDNTTGVTSLATGYNIPTNASTTDWNNKVSSQWTTVSPTNISYSGTTSVNNLKSLTSAGLIIYSNSGSQVANFGAGGGQAVSFSNGGSFANYLRVGSSAHGDSMFESKASTNDGSTGIIHGYDSNNNELLTLQSNGKLGLGSTTPNEVLSVTGNVNATNYYGSIGSGTVQYSGTLNEIFGNSKEPTGFANYDNDNIISFATSTRTFTIAPSGSYYVTYYRGKKFTYTTSTSTIIANETKTHFIYFDSNGQLQNTTAVWDISAANAVPVAAVYWNGSTSKALLLEEQHGLTMDAQTHAYLHNTVGARYQSGFSGTFDNNRGTTTAGVFWDDDINHTEGQQVVFNVFNRRADSQWDITGSQNAYYRTNGTTLLYDNAGASTTVSVSSYVAYWIFAVNATSTPIVSVMGQRQDTTLANAQANNTYASLSLGNFPAQEAKLLYRVIMRNVAGTPTWIETQDNRALSTLAGGGTAVQDHGTLSGLTDDDHTQYLLVDGTRAQSALYLTGKFSDSVNASGTVGQVLTSTGTSTLWTATSSLGLTDPAESTSTIGALINGSTATTTPADTDRFAFSASSLLRHITWSNIKSSLKTYFDTLYGAISGQTWTGTHTFSSAILKAPNSASLVTNSAGEIGIDTTSNQLRYYGTATSTLSPILTPAITIASTSLAGTGTTTIPLGYAGAGETWTNAICGTAGGTGVGTTTLRFGDGTNYTNTITATSTAYSVALSSNNTFTSAEKREIQIQSVAGTPNYISCTILKTLATD